MCKRKMTVYRYILYFLHILHIKLPKTPVREDRKKISIPLRKKCANVQTAEKVTLYRHISTIKICTWNVQTGRFRKFFIAKIVKVETRLQFSHNYAGRYVTPILARSLTYRNGRNRAAHPDLIYPAWGAIQLHARFDMPISVRNASDRSRCNRRNGGPHCELV